MMGVASQRIDLLLPEHVVHGLDSMSPTRRSSTGGVGLGLQLR